MVAHSVFKLCRPLSWPILICAIGFARTPSQIADNTGSDDSIQQCKSWLNSCSRLHVACSFTGPHQQWIPSRLLEICLDSGRVMLRMRNEVHSQCASYATLSHCWGSISIVKLTRKTLQGLRENIPLKSLPKTFFDAVSFTRQMGLRFLWIDSLCVVQDSADDWRKEASQMADVYRNAHFNIAATAAPNGNHGIFYCRDTLKIGSCFVSTNWDGTWPISDRKMKGLYYLTRKDAFDDDVSHAHLNKRGWVIQERVLSRRIFHFSKYQIYWECSDAVASESFPSGLGETQPLGYKAEHCFHLTLPEAQKLLEERRPASFEQRIHYTRSLRHASGTATPTGSSHKLYSTWRRLVEHFTMCKLTVSTDKLIAIEGIASTLVPWLDDVYMAGCWKGSILYDLLWQVDYSTKSIRLPLENRAPSWSWASIDAAIDFQLTYRHETKEQTFHTTVVDLPIAQGTPDSSWPLLKPAIRLCGPLKKATSVERSWIDRQTDKWDIQDRIVTLELDVDIPKALSDSRSILGCVTTSGLDSVSVSLDCLPAELFFLPIVSGVDIEYGDVSVRGLALLPTGRKRGEFFRYGVFDATDPETKDTLLGRGDVERNLYETMTDDVQYVVSIV